VNEHAEGRKPSVIPLGDSAALVRFGTVLDEIANAAAIALSQRLAVDPIDGVVEVAPSLVSVLLRYDPSKVSISRIGGEVALRLGLGGMHAAAIDHRISVRFDGPDLRDVAAELGMSQEAFILAHNNKPLRVLATGFAPGFVYCGFHPTSLVLPRRTTVRPIVPAGSILFAAGQTAIAATDIPTGWHLIGSTDFRNFDPSIDPPTRLAAGELIEFEVAS
jgi:KipI family sensor histidine kinase inhibitor